MSLHPRDAVRRWLNTPPHLAKLTLGFLATMHAIFAVGMVMVSDVVYRHIWPAWFGLAAMACAIAMVRFNHRTAAVAGAATITAFIGRAVAVAWSLQVDRLPGLSAPRVVITITAWMSLAIMSGLLFFRGLLQVTAKLEREDR